LRITPIFGRSEQREEIEADMGQGSLDTTDSIEWKNAASHIEKLGRLPPLFSAPIRALMISDPTEAKGASLAAEFLVMRLLRSATFKSIFYFTAMTFRSESILSLAYVSSYDLIRLYNARDLAGIISIIFAYRKVKTLASEHGVPEEVIVLDEIQTRVDIGAHLGLAVPKLGMLCSMQAAGLPMLAHGIMAIGDVESMRSYKQHLKEAKLPFDLAYERDCWQTTCLHVCARLLQQLGFGPAYATDYFQGMQSRPDSVIEGKLEDLRYPTIDIWTTALLETGVAPTTPIIGHFYPLQKDLHKLLYEVTCLKEKGSKHRWLDKTKSEISPHTTPQLYQEVLAEMSRGEDVRQFMAANLPASMVDSLSDQEIAEIASGRVDEDE
jgi:hypothetical protein